MHDPLNVKIVNVVKIIRELWAVFFRVLCRVSHFSVLKINQPVQMEWRKDILCQVTQAATSKLAGRVLVAFHFLKIIFMYSGDIIFNTEISGFRKSKRRLMLVMDSPINTTVYDCIYIDSSHHRQIDNQHWFEQYKGTVLPIKNRVNCIQPKNPSEIRRNGCVQMIQLFHSLRQ
jgi:hypothetical protein